MKKVCPFLMVLETLIATQNKKEITEAAAPVEGHIHGSERVRHSF
jgi:hypothetical protein